MAIPESAAARRLAELQRLANAGLSAMRGGSNIEPPSQQRVENSVSQLSSGPEIFRGTLSNRATQPIGDVKSGPLAGGFDFSEEESDYQEGDSVVDAARRRARNISLLSREGQMEDDYFTQPPDEPQPQSSFVEEVVSAIVGDLLSGSGMRR